MGKMSISLDEQAESWVQAQEGNAEAYVNALIHQDQQRKAAEAELRTMLENARASGMATRTPQQIMADVKSELKSSGQL